MKKFLKRAVPSLVFCLIPSIIFLGCVEKDIESITIDSLEIEENAFSIETESRIKTLTYDEIPSVMNDLMSRIGKSSKNINTGKLKHNNVAIFLEDIKEIVNEGSNRNYTFALDVKDSPNYIYNLIMTKGEDGSMQDPVIVGYKMKPKDLNTFFENGEDYNYFITEYRYYKFDAFFEDSKFNRVGKSGDCGGGTTGGNTGGSSQTPPGGTFNHNYGGHSVTNIFSNDAVNIPYGYTSTIRTQNAQVNTVSTAGTSGTVQIATTGPTGTLLSHNVPTQTVSVQVTSEGNGPSGPGDICLVVTTFGDGHVTIDNIPCQGAQQKTNNTSKSGDCTGPDGTFAINTAARSIEKLDYHLPGGLNAGQLNWFNDSNFPERKFMAQDLVWFLLDNNKSEESIIFVLMAVDALVNGGSVDVDDRIIRDKSFVNSKANCVLDILLKQTGYFKEVMDAFTNNNSEYKLKFTTGPVRDGADAQTSTPDANGIITITFRPASAEAKDLEIAGILLHEGVHAQLQRIIASGNNVKYNLTNDQYTWLIDLNKWWEGHSVMPVETAQHDFMSVLYVNPIAEAVRKYDNYKHSKQNYMYFGWEGLYDEGSNRGLINMSQFNEFTRLAQIPLTDNHKTSCE
ncbi:hypothetical protein [Maribacter sp. 1_MG-2023]|uniref:hypothetical protein n=1 Tax=Maribacter sp. 1_MG-2023 TaxID=3062677 RepID=UPI0026E34047|nr:hypothetical protein [Maribacter sp. 1_MG-2023]MDO6471001.1 hypothetical protein [Maribacter sp. 1_MG-2023]